MALTMEQESAIHLRDLALAMHETFLSSGSEDALSPRVQNLDIRGSRSPRVERISGVDRKQLPVADEAKTDGSEPGKLDENYLKNLRETEFQHHEKGAARLNNGSFGSCPKSVLLWQTQWVHKWLKQPDAFYAGPLEQGLLESRQAIASHVHCPAEEIALLDNVTEGACIVAMDVMWKFFKGQYQKGELILLSNFTYGALRNVFEAYAVRAGASILDAEIPFPVSSASEILATYGEVLRGAKNDGRVIRLAVIDHVVSMPSIVIPVKEIVALCRRYGVEQIFVDGAQAAGNLDIDVQEIAADYYTGNLHKWFFAPSAVAFFHCKAIHLSRLHHPIVSNNYPKGIVAECGWVGTRDYSAMLAVPAIFAFVNRIPGGLEALRIYNHKKVIAAGKMLAEAWGTYCGVAPELCSSMVMVGLPPALQILNTQDAEALRTRLRKELSIEIHTYTPVMKDDGNSDQVTAHLRVSHQIYNTWEEYLRLRDGISALVVEMSKGQKTGASGGSAS